MSVHSKNARIDMTRGEPAMLLPGFLGTTGIWLSSPLGWILGILPPLFYLIRWLKKINGPVKA